VAEPTDRFDPLLLSQVRLGVISVLMTRKETTFSDLKSLLGLTQGNLGIHLKKLEEAEYVKIKKEFVRNKPRTSCRITARGRNAFLGHVEQLKKIAGGKGEG
jgi:DNA-binding transcriptional ArsR family regulator